jgi:hypothetical protein
MTAVGQFVSDEPESAYVIAESYFAREAVSESFERDGLSITFNGQRRPLEDYSRALEAAGFCIEAIREPVPPDDLVARMPSYRRLLRIPSFLHFRARRV